MPVIPNNSTLYPEVTVGALIFNDDKKILLMKSYKWNNMYCLPGGHIELGETAEQAVIREVKEETNLDIVDIKFHCVQDAIFAETFYQKRHFVFLDFICKATTNYVILNDEADEYKWININEVDKHQIEPFTKRTIELYLHPSSDVYLSIAEEKQ